MSKIKTHSEAAQRTAALSEKDRSTLINVMLTWPAYKDMTYGQLDETLKEYCERHSQ